MCGGAVRIARLACAVVLSFRANPTDAAVHELPGAYAYELVSLCGRWGVDGEDVLETTGLTVEALKNPSGRLGYSDVANFTRAFRRWTGQTPAAFRR